MAIGFGTGLLAQRRLVRINDTLHNVIETGEFVVNLCPWSIARQMLQCGEAYPRGVDELERSGLTRLDSLLVRPSRVAESPVQLECRLHRVVRHGEGVLASFATNEDLRQP